MISSASSKGFKWVIWAHLVGVTVPLRAIATWLPFTLTTL